MGNKMNLQDFSITIILLSTKGGGKQEVSSWTPTGPSLGLKGHF